MDVQDTKLEGATVERSWTINSGKSMGVTLQIGEGIDAPIVSGLLWWGGETWKFRSGDCAGEGVSVKDALEAYLADRRAYHREHLAMLRSHFGPDPELFD